MRRLALSLLPLALLGLAACALDAEPDVDAEDGSGESALTDASPEARAVLALVNDPRVGDDELAKDARIGSKAAIGIVGRRDGADGTPGTADDRPFATIKDLDGVKWVGATTLTRLAAYAKKKGLYGGKVEVVFSPQPWESSHLPRIAALIDGAKKSVDVAMYSFSDAKVSASLEAAVKRGVKVRFLFETAGEDKSLTGAALEASKSGLLEKKGVDVRYVNKILHHKFVLVDGPQTSADEAMGTRLATGSANWSNGGATRYDENTLFIESQPELALAYQREFDLLWEHSRDFTLSTERPVVASSLRIDDALIPDSPSAGALFTSANFAVKDTTFRTEGRDAVADQLVAAIQGATKSIHLASGHLRSRKVAEALMAKRAASPSLDIRVYLDGQEFLSKSAHAAQVVDWQKCVAAAGGNESKIRTCNDKGFLFGYQTSLTVDVRFKIYAYRWDNSYADQMHNKFMVVDGSTLFTGSYNLSDNAEHETFENVVVLRAPEYAATIGAFERNFESLWKTGDGKLDGLRQTVEAAPEIPIVFPAMALTWQQANDLRALIRVRCPAVDSQEYRENAPGHRTCKK
jgi:hypothetical protein